MPIPPIAWFIVTAACLAGCIAWHRKAPSKPLVMTACGLCWMLVLGLPGLFASFFGHRELGQHVADLFPDWAARESGLTEFGMTLGYWSFLLSRLGAVLIALGLWKLGSTLTPKPEEFPPA